MDITLKALSQAKSSLPKLGDIDKESEYGVIYSVSGPGVLNGIQSFHMLTLMFSCGGRKYVWLCYGRIGKFDTVYLYTLFY